MLERLEDPIRSGSWDRRGMVAGQVQSGKTANYTGLICKAADAGYRLIVVLAGMHNNLRSQTQLRLDEGFLGYNTRYRMTFDQSNLRVGVGALRGEKLHPVQSLTHSEDAGDFKLTIAKHSSIDLSAVPLLLVVKKQGSILRNLNRWLTGRYCQWLETQLGITACYKTVHQLVHYRLKAAPKVARPVSTETSEARVEAAKKTR